MKTQHCFSCLQENPRKRRDKFDSGKLVNKEMSNAVYQLRRRVIDIIYEIKEIAEIPRVEVRITDDHHETLGRGTMGGTPIIWITERAITADQFDLRTIVYHEVLHAVYNVNHDEDCPLMRPIHTPMSKEEVQKHFLKWVKKSKKK